MARMLCLKGHEMGLKMFVLSESREDPAAQVTSHWCQGSPYKKKDLRSFLSLVNLASFESEFLDADQLGRLQKELRTPIFPDPSIMAKLQDRFEQKKLLQKAGLPVSPFWLCHNKEEGRNFCKNKKDQAFVFKKRRSGYDGYGTFIFPPSTLSLPLWKKYKKIDSLFSLTSQGFIVEDFVSFKRELALSVVRNRAGQVVFLPLVESYQEKACCLWVKGPVQHPKLSRLKNKIRKFLHQIRYQGIMAFELFDMGSRLLVNEIAPRVHNSAHYSLNALTEDQFTFHLKASLNLTLEKSRLLQPGFAMLNLLGNGRKNFSWNFPLEGISWHWYGKSENRRGRKMGHMNALGSTPNRALLKLLKVKNELTSSSFG